MAVETTRGVEGDAEFLRLIPLSLRLSTADAGRLVVTRLLSSIPGEPEFYKPPTSLYDRSSTDRPSIGGNTEITPDKQDHETYVESNYRFQTSSTGTSK